MHPFTFEQIEYKMCATKFSPTAKISPEIFLVARTMFGQGTSFSTFPMNPCSKQQISAIGPMSPCSTEQVSPAGPWTPVASSRFQQMAP